MQDAHAGHHHARMDMGGDGGMDMSGDHGMAVSVLGHICLTFEPT